MAYTFTPIAADHLPMLAGWLREPHVQAWWGDPDKELAKVTGDIASPFVRGHIVAADGVPFAYIQAWDIHHWGVFTDQPKGTWGLDQFIGEPAMLGKGHGSAFMALFAQKLLDEGAPRVITDPDPHNARAVRAYEKAGFQIVGPRTEPDGPVVLMARDPGQTKGKA